MTKIMQKMVLRLRMSPYGLKQALHIWYVTLKEFICAIHFMESQVNRGLFVLEDQGTVMGAVIL